LPDAAFASSYNSNANANSRTDTDRNAYTYSYTECNAAASAESRVQRDASPLRSAKAPGVGVIPPSAVVGREF
jgi:hypothetical protein